MSNTVEISNRNSIFQIFQDTENTHSPRNIKRESVHHAIPNGKRQALSTITNQTKNTTNAYSGILRSKKQVKSIRNVHSSHTVNSTIIYYQAAHLFHLALYI